MADHIEVTVNGEPRQVAAEPERSLLTVLREELGLTGAKYGCAVGACGACTVLAGGQPVRACVTPVAAVAGREVTTVEGLTPEGRLHPVQAAFVAEDAMQCGYCTPGMVMATAALLSAQPDPDDEEIARRLDGNVCRCGAYPRILAAVRRAAHAAKAAPAGTTAAGTALGDPEPASASSVAVAGGAPPGRSGAVPWDLLPAQDRGYFDVLADGLVAVRAVSQTADGWAGLWQRGLGAWLHVGADGTVTAFTGKVDVGQDNTTALAMLVAEELRVPLPAVRMVMGDTDVCPFDIGTLGSRSMPDAGGALQAAAAAARRALIGLAAAAWEVEPDGLDASGGAVRDPGAGRAASYAELVRGLRRVVTAAEDEPVTDARSWRTAGRPTPKSHATAAVRGTRRFTSDMSLPGMLHGKVLRPPAYGATLRSADLSRARLVPGVIAVHEGTFAAVAAPDPVTAAYTLGLVEAEWDRPAQPAEQDLAQFLRRNPLGGGEQPAEDEAGDVATVLDTADVRCAATYTAAYIAHVPLEPRAALAEWSGGRLTVWTGTQRPFNVRQELADALGVPQTSVRVVVPPTGSGFGGKHAGPVAVEAATLARATRRPVKVQWSREEEFTCGYFRPAAVIDVASGANEDGTLAGWEFTNFNSGAAAIRTPYRVPARSIKFQPARSPLPQGSYRALAATANTFARESHMDELAHALGADPLEFRLRNLRDDRLAATLRAAAERAGWPRHGLGIACGVEKEGRVATCAEVSVQAGRRLAVHRIVTAYECGSVVNPSNVVNQIDGATVIALGGALFEAIHFGDGAVLNASLSQYRVPRFSDVPPIEVVLLDRRDLPAAGAGETPLIAVAPALANAIFAVSGVRLRSMPLVPDGVVPAPAG